MAGAAGDPSPNTSNGSVSVLASGAGDETGEMGAPVSVAPFPPPQPISTMATSSVTAVTRVLRVD
jgi:hypothetical protein